MTLSITIRKKRAAIVVGANGGIGKACLTRLLRDDGFEVVIGIGRKAHPADLPDDSRLDWLISSASESDIKSSCKLIKEHNLDVRLIIIATGLLHNETLQIKPEKRLADVSIESLQTIFSVNTYLPVIWLKYLSTCLDRNSETKIAVLSARVGSIADNGLGGWHSYRASKAALNMLLKNIAIEFKRRYPNTKTISFHPGTTDTQLSQPFQSNVPEGKLFSPDFVAEQLYQLLTQVKPDGLLSFKDWARKDIDW